MEQDEFEKELQKIFQDLLAKQEPLGAEFEKVLEEHLWDLYEN